GDTVQAMKAGTMELADIYVVNKSELAGAAQLAAEIRRVQALRAAHDGWQAPVVLTSIHDGDSISALSAAIDAHQAWLDEHADRAGRLAARARYRLQLLLERRLGEVLDALSADTLEQPLDMQFAAALAALPLDRTSS
ncbi:MAG: methylmalonyl Co-A mutase-associated GTPase MeaB, partial [Gammaproteobacteria bacterium]